MKCAILYVKTYNPHNHTQIPKSTQGSKTHKIQILKEKNFFAIDKVYTNI